MKEMLMFLLVLALSSSGVQGQAGVESRESGTFQDSRDGEVYAWVRIGGQVWMAENLRFATPTGSMCWENKESECATRGRYYTWEAAMEAPPPGWHLPSDQEWMKLEMTLGLTREQAEESGIDRGGPVNTIGAARSIRSGRPGQYGRGSHEEGR